MILTRRNLILAATAGIFVPKYGRWFNRLREPTPAGYTTITMRSANGSGYIAVLEQSVDGSRTWSKVEGVTWTLRPDGAPICATIPAHQPSTKYHFRAQVSREPLRLDEFFPHGLVFA